jgi:serine/threonine protein kinase
MNAELELIASRLKQAQTPEDVFGKIQGDCLPAIKKSYHALAKTVHPDLFPGADDKILAHIAFGQLIEWFRQAEEKVRFGVYGRARHGPAQIILQSKYREYCIDDEPVQDAIFASYPCRFDEDGRSHPASLKVVRNPHHNELSQNEIRALNILQNAPEAAKFSAYIPSLIDAFVYQDEGGEHQATVFDRTPGWYSLEDVHRAYPSGIDPKDMAWIFRRLLVALGFAHHNGIIYNAMSPQNVYILPDEHGLMLTNWPHAICDSVDFGGSAPSFGTDIGLSVKCMIFLLGGDSQHGLYPDSVPNPLRAFFKGSMLPGKKAPQDAWALKEEFDELIERLWGKRTFHPFVMQ